MNHILKLAAAALALSLPAVLSSPASAAVVSGYEATVSPSADDDPIYVLLGDASVELQRLTMNDDRNETK